MRGPLTRHVDPWRAGAAGEVLSGSLAAAALPRLRALAPPVEPLQARLDFVLQAGSPGVVRISARVSGRCTVTCQRCLEPMVLPCQVESTLLVVPDEVSARTVAGDLEALVSAPGQALDLVALVEDEVMLSLPFAPRHDPGQCPPEALAAAGPVGGVEQAGCAGADAAPDSEGRDNPFAVLAALRRAHRDEN